MTKQIQKRLPKTMKLRKKFLFQHLVLKLTLQISLNQHHSLKEGLSVPQYLGAFALNSVQ